VRFSIWKILATYGSSTFFHCSAVPVASSVNVSSTETVERLLYALSSSTGIDHPLCSSCASVLQRILQDKLEDVQKERDAYISFEREWQATKKAEKEAAPDGVVESDADVCAKLEKTNKQLEENALRLIEELKGEEEEERLLDVELLEVQQEEEELERQEIR
jgi:beclin 1